MTGLGKKTIPDRAISCKISWCCPRPGITRVSQFTKYKHYLAWVKWCNGLFVIPPPRSFQEIFESGGFFPCWKVLGENQFGPDIYCIFVFQLDWCKLRKLLANHLEKPLNTGTAVRLFELLRQAAPVPAGSAAECSSAVHRRFPKLGEPEREPRSALGACSSRHGGCWDLGRARSSDGQAPQPHMKEVLGER